jgi:hypothetical protein
MAVDVLGEELCSPKLLKDISGGHGGGGDEKFSSPSPFPLPVQRVHADLGVK